MTDVLLIASVIAVMIIAGVTLMNHSKKTRQELMDEMKEEVHHQEILDKKAPTEVPEAKVEQVVESPEEAPVPKPAKKRRRGRPAAKKD
jgi:hypothetical protein